MGARLWGTIRNVLWASFFAAVIWLSAREETTVQVSAVPARLVIRHLPDLAVRLPEELGNPPTIKVDLSGPEAQMERLLLEELEAVVPLPSADRGRIVLPITPDLLHLRETEVSVGHIEPSQIEIFVDQVSERSLPVSPPAIEATLPEGLVVDTEHITIDPILVPVRGPVEALAEIEAVDVEPVVVQGWPEGSRTIVRNIELPARLSSTVDHVRVTIPIRRALAQQTLQIPIQYVMNDPGSLPFRIVPAPAQTTQGISVSASGEPPELTVVIEGDQPRLDRIRQNPAAEGLLALILVDRNAPPLNRYQDPEVLPAEPGHDLPVDLKINVLVPTGVRLVSPAITPTSPSLKVDILRPAQARGESEGGQ